MVEAINRGEAISQHWNMTFQSHEETRLGWFEQDFTASMRLIKKSGVSKEARIFLAGAGTSRLVDQLLELGYENLVVADISQTALDTLARRVGRKIEIIRDDLTRPGPLKQIKPVDLWFDRAVLHFFVDKEDRLRYFDLLRSLTIPGSKVILAEFSLHGAKICSGLPVQGYSVATLQNELESDFTCLESFDYDYKMPSGDLRPYIYALFGRNR